MATGVPAFAALGKYLGSGIARLYGNSLLNFLRTTKLFHSNHTILQSYQQCTRVPVSPYLYNTYFPFFLIIVIQTSVKWYLVLIYISLMINDVEHLLYAFHIQIIIFFFEKHVCLNPLSSFALFFVVEF